MSTAPYLEHFQATRRRVEDLSKDPAVGDFTSDLPGYIYADRFFIEIEADGGLYLPIVQEEHRGTEADLATLEALLFDYAKDHEGLTAEDCHAACAAHQIACPPVCRICEGAA